MCVYCKGSHHTTNCEVHKDLESRLAIIKQEKLCFNCLVHHRVSQCGSKNRCRKCNAKHHTSICNKPASKGTTQSEEKEQPNLNSTTTTLTAFVPPQLTRNTICLLKTAIATVVNANLQVEANILFDEGSQRSFITEKLAGMLGVVPQRSENINLSSFGSSQPLYRRMDNVTFRIKTRRGDLVPISALVVPTIAAPLANTMNTAVTNLSHLKGLPLAHPVSGEDNFEISLLIGADFYWDLIGDHTIRRNGPTAVSSRLGYLLSGPLPVPQPSSVVTSLLSMTANCSTDEQDLQKFWTVEDAGVAADNPDKKFLEHYSESHITRQADGSYSAMFPWKDNHPPLPNNYQICQGEPLDKHFLADWTAILTDICRCPDISVKRQYFDINFMKHGNNMKLHAFADASTKAYGAVIFLCYLDHTTFVIAKGRVAPLKQITLPKLELMAAVIAARLTRFVIDSLPLDVTPHLWTDSQIVLFWLQSTKPLPQFINHRVREITQLIPNAIWRHCPTVDNPADLLTRGLSFDQFNTSSLWWHGPEWLTDQDKWPLWNPQSVSQLHVAAATADEFVPQPPTTDHNIGLHQVMTPENYSSLNRLLAVTAYIQRFVDNLRLSDGARKVTPLSSAELSTAKRRWIKHCQEQAFSSEISALKSTGQIRQTNKSTCLVRQLRLFLDNDGLLRCGGRIHNAPISDIAKFPYLLPRKNGFTQLLIYSLHNKTFHGGVNSTLTALRHDYWVPSGRQYIKGLLRLCTTCKRHHGKPYPAPEPAPLPKDRLRDTTPFTITGVDFTGALYVQDNTGESKVYICLFTCATTRAIHLEVVTDLSVETFMLAFRRFVSRKSLPHIMMSDNASTYLSAAE